MQPTFFRSDRVGFRLAGIGLLAVCISVQGTRRAAAIPVTVDHIVIDRSDPAIAANTTSLDISVFGTSGPALPSVPIALKIAGDTGDAQTLSLVTDASGMGHFSYTPTFPGRVTYEAFN